MAKTAKKGVEGMAKANGYTGYSACHFGQLVNELAMYRADMVFQTHSVTTNLPSCKTW